MTEPSFKTMVITIDKEKMIITHSKKITR